MTLPPAELRFTLINNLSSDEVKKSTYVIYAHTCPDGSYIGLTSDPVKRWQEHFSDAFNENSPYYNDSFKVAIRKHKNHFDHYILAIANFEGAAKKKEAAAIKFYKGNLNTRNETITNSKDYGFKDIKNQLGRIEILRKKGKSGTSVNLTDNDRKTVIGEVIIESGKKRVRSLPGGNFPAGLKIRCSRDERKKFNLGDKVSIKVSLTEKDGTPFLQAATTAKLTPVK